MPIKNSKNVINFIQYFQVSTTQNSIFIVISLTLILIKAITNNIRWYTQFRIQTPINFIQSKLLDSHILSCALFIVQLSSCFENTHLNMIFINHISKFNFAFFEHLKFFVIVFRKFSSHMGLEGAVESYHFERRLELWKYISLFFLFCFCSHSKQICNYIFPVFIMQNFMIKLINNLRIKNYHQHQYQIIVLQYYRLIKIMRIRATTSKKNSTEDLPKALNFLNMRKRVNQIKYKASSKSFNIRKSKLDNSQPEVERTIIYKKPSDLESDTSSTNFWPPKQQTPISLSSKISSQQYTVNRRSQDAKLTLSRPQSHIMHLRSRYRSFKKQGRGIDIETYRKQMQYFSKLYQLLGNVLASIKNGLQDVQNTVSAYGQFIRDPYLSFMDDFTEGKSQKVKKTVKTSRIHQYLSIAYLFLQIAQDRIENNQSYLVNFIGYSLSNLIFTAKTYILLERRPQFPETEFEKQMNQFQINSYGSILTSLDDVLLRVQHNNQIITMIHKKLGKWNPKFEECISAFLKNAERRKYTTCLCSHYIFQYLAMHIHEVELVGISQFLQVSPTPYLAPPKNDYTLIIQPLGIIKNNEQLRPYLMQFIKWASKYFDIVLWTWEMPNQVQDVAELLDPYLFSKLYRYHCIIKDQVFTKDLTRLGRNLKKTIIIDYDERIFSNTPKNGFVARWKGHFKDKGLLVISQIFQEMIGSQSEVEDMLTFYAQQLHSIRGA